MPILEVPVPKALRPVRRRLKGLDAQELQHEVVDLNVREGVHHVGVVRRGVPTLVRAGEPATREGVPALMQSFDDGGEGPMRDEHGVHLFVVVVVPVAL